MVELKVGLCIFLFFLFNNSDGQEKKYNKLYPILNEYVRDFPDEFRKIPEDRRYRLNEIIYFLKEQEENNAPLQLTFIGTNQSSVSQMAQVWSKTAAYYFGYPELQSFSSGIKSNEISVNAITTLEKAGFIIYKSNIDGVDVYRVKYSNNLEPIVTFSKKIGHMKNPDTDYMAVFVEENADLNISNLKGTYNRLLLSYNDPIGYDGSGLENQFYEESCKTVAIEMFYVFSQLRKRTAKNHGTLEK